MAKKKKFETRFVEEYRLSIKPNYIVGTTIMTGSTSRRSQKMITNQDNLKNHATEGHLSDKSKKKLLSSINWLVHSAKPKTAYNRKFNSNFKFKLSFVTLTIPVQESGSVSEKKFKILLNTWLTYSRKYMKLANYVWKIEAHKDGRLHVHITADSFLHYAKVRNSWNTILQRNGLLEYHYKKFDNYNPNSTDIHSVREVRNIVAYVAKYMSKNTAINTLYKGRIWGCNQVLSKANECKLVISIDEFSKVGRCLDNPELEYKAIKTKPNYLGDTYHLADMWFIKMDDWKNNIKGKIKEAFVNQIKLIQNVLIPDTALKLELN